MPNTAEQIIEILRAGGDAVKKIHPEARLVLCEDLIENARRLIECGEDKADAARWREQESFFSKCADEARDDLVRDAEIAPLRDELQSANARHQQLESELVEATQGVISAHDTAARVDAEIESLTSQLQNENTRKESADDRTNKFEKLLGLSGVASKSVVPVSAQADDSPSAVWSEYQRLKQCEKDGTQPHGSALKFWRKNKKALENYADARRGVQS